MAYFTQDQIDRAKSIDLLTYLKNNNPDELVFDSRNSYKTRTHDSLKISNGLWYWFTREVGGKSAIDYLMKVKNYKFVEAVKTVMGNIQIQPPRNQISPRQQTKRNEHGKGNTDLRSKK